MVNTVVLIGGATRGLGKALLGSYLSKPSHTVIAFNREPMAAPSQALTSLPTGRESKLLVVKSDASVRSDPFSAVEELEKQGIDHIDLIIASAAVGLEAAVPAFSETSSLSEDNDILSLPTHAPARRSQNPVPSGTYGPSKAAIHWLTKRMNAEEELVTAFVMDPGWVQTDMGNLGATTYGFEKAPLEIKESIAGMDQVIGEATKEIHGGKMWAYNGKEQQW